MKALYQRTHFSLFARGFLILTIMTLLWNTAPLAAQNRIIKGITTDATNGTPLNGALILDPVTKRGAITGEDGTFRLELPDSIVQLEATYLGYFSTTFMLDVDTSVLQIALAPMAILLEDIVIPFDAISKNKPTFAATEDIPLNIQNINNGTNVLPLLNSVAGVYVHSGALNTNRITIRGIGARAPFSTRNVKMYYNEIPINSVDGESVMEDLDVSSFDKIHIIKGPSATTMGVPLSGALVLGNYDWFTSSEAQASITLGSYGLWRQTTNLRLRGDRTAINLFYNDTKSEGYRDNNQYDRKSGGFNFKYNPNARHSFHAIGHFAHLNAQIPSSIDSATFANAPQSAASNWASVRGYEAYYRGIIGLNHTYLLDNLDSKNSFSWSNSLFSNFRDQYEVRPFNVLSDDVVNVGIRSVMNYYNTNASRLNWKLTAGTEHLTEWYDWQTYEILANATQGDLLADNFETRQTTNLFTQLNLGWLDAMQGLERFSVSVGINANRTRYDLEDRFTQDSINQSGSHFYKWIYSPKLSISHTFSKYYLYKNVIYANISHGFSLPSVEETLLPDGLINPDLLPETGWNFEVGTKGNLFDGRILYDFTIYRMLINNLIVADRIDADSYVGVNAGETQHDGLELTLAYNYKTILGNLNLRGSYTNNNFKFVDFNDDGEDYSGNDLTGVPANTFNFRLQWQGAQRLPLFAMLAYQFVDEMPIYDNNSLYTSAYHFVNAKVNYEWHIPLNSNTLQPVIFNTFIGVNNLFDEHYAAMIAVNARSFGTAAPRIYYPSLPRNWYAGFDLKITF